MHEQLSADLGAPALLEQHGVLVTYRPERGEPVEVLAAPTVDPLEDQGERQRGRVAHILVAKRDVPAPAKNADTFTVPAIWFDETAGEGETLDVPLSDIPAGQTSSGLWRFRLGRKGTP